MASSVRRLAEVKEQTVHDHRVVRRLADGDEFMFPMASLFAQMSISDPKRLGTKRAFGLRHVLTMSYKNLGRTLRDMYGIVLTTVVLYPADMPLLCRYLVLVVYRKASRRCYRGGGPDCFSTVPRRRGHSFETLLRRRRGFPIS